MLTRSNVLVVASIAYSNNTLYLTLYYYSYKGTPLDLDSQASPKENTERDGKPAIDSKPQIRVRNPPGGKSSIFF